eukprot:7444194-Alexandrium_andersonii.AAC.1
MYAERVHMGKAVVVDHAAPNAQKQLAVFRMLSDSGLVSHVSNSAEAAQNACGQAESSRWSLTARGC